MTPGRVEIPREAVDYLSYDPISGLVTWRQRPHRAGRVLAGDVAGRAVVDGYIRVKFRGCGFFAHRFAFVAMTGTCPAFVDHRDGDPSNNRWFNLRVATPTDNMANRRGFGALKKGVSLTHGRYGASIMRAGRYVFLGCHGTEDAAHAAYVRAAEDMHGEFARAQ